MELLDHLLDGQKVGQTAVEIFGDDPKRFADELIEQLPKEEKRQLIPFFGGIIATIIGWFLIIRGFLFLLLSRFTEVKTMVYPLSSICIALVIAGFVIFTIVLILKLIKRSLFKEKDNTTKSSILAGVVAAFGMAVVLLVAKFMPEIGPAYDFSWWASILGGGVILLIRYGSKKFKSM